jgi:hypothetical protein
VTDFFIRSRRLLTSGAEVRFNEKMAIGASLAVMVVVNWISPGFAKNPFRKTNPRPIGDKTEAAFNAIFKQGNYLEAKKLIVEATERNPKNLCPMLCVPLLLLPTRIGTPSKPTPRKLRQRPNKCRTATL